MAQWLRDLKVEEVLPPVLATLKAGTKNQVAGNLHPFKDR